MGPGGIAAEVLYEERSLPHHHLHAQDPGRGGAGSGQAYDAEALGLAGDPGQRCVTEAGPGVSLNNKLGFVTNVTLAKLSKPVARMRRSMYINCSYYEAHIKDTFGLQNIDNLQLCVIHRLVNKIRKVLHYTY